MVTMWRHKRSDQIARVIFGKQAWVSSRERRSRKGQWRERIAEQERSGLSVRQFCKEQGLAEHCFYGWRQRPRKQEKQVPVRFALVERGSSLRGPVMEAGLELMLVSGERLRNGSGVNAVTLLTVLEALRA